MHKLSTFSKEKGIKSLTVIKASLYSQFLGRPLLEAYWIVRINTLNSQGFYKKVSVVSGTTEEQKTLSSQPDNFKRHARNRKWASAWPLTTLLNIRYNKTWGNLVNNGKVWLSCQINSKGVTVPRWYVYKRPKWWRVVFFWFIPCEKWKAVY